MPANEAEIEKMLVARGKTAPRVKPEDIDNTILATIYWQPNGTTLTVCALILRNGFIVTGESAAASVDNFDREVGERIAYQNARQKIWAFEGYLLRQKLHDAAMNESEENRVQSQTGVVHRHIFPNGDYNG